LIASNKTNSAPPKGDALCVYRTGDVEQRRFFVFLWKNSSVMT
jgi:hypothetical protein